MSVLYNGYHEYSKEYFSQSCAAGLQHKSTQKCTVLQTSMQQQLLSNSTHTARQCTVCGVSLSTTRKGFQQLCHAQRQPACEERSQQQPCQQPCPPTTSNKQNTRWHIVAGGGTKARTRNLQGQGRTDQPEGAVAALQQGGDGRLNVRVGVLPAGLALVHSHAHLLPEHGRAVLGQPLPQL